MVDLSPTQMRCPLGTQAHTYTPHHQLLWLLCNFFFSLRVFGLSDWYGLRGDNVSKHSIVVVYTHKILCIILFYSLNWLMVIRFTEPFSPALLNELLLNNQHWSLNVFSYVRKKKCCYYFCCWFTVTTNNNNNRVEVNERV